MKNSFVIVDEAKFQEAIEAVGLANAADARKTLIARDFQGTYRIVSIRSGPLHIRTEKVRKLEEAEE